LEVAVTAFSPLLSLLEEVPDPRRAEGKVYRLPHVLLFSSPNSAWLGIWSRSMPCIAKKTFEAGAEAQVDLFIQLKDNQPSLHQHAKDLCATSTPLSHVSSRDRGHNRQEQRCVTVFNAATAFTDPHWSAIVGDVNSAMSTKVSAPASTASKHSSRISSSG